jgi:Tfp pilus assembly protein PilW
MSRIGHQVLRARTGETFVLGQRGIALLDVLVAMALLGIMSTGLFVGFQTGLANWLISQQYAAEQQNGRTAVNRVVRTLRMAGYNYSPTATNPAFIYADAHEVDLYGDLDNTGTAQCYRFYLNNGIVYEAKVTGSLCGSSIITATGNPLTTAVEAKTLTFTELDFTYWSAADLGGGQLASTPLSASDRALVRRVEVTVKVRGLSANENPVTIITDAVVRQGE